MLSVVVHVDAVSWLTRVKSTPSPTLKDNEQIKKVFVCDDCGKDCRCCDPA